MSPDLHHLSGAYALDALDESEHAAFEEHLTTCADCRAEVAELVEAAHRLGALAEATPPAHLRDSVLGRIAQVRPLPPLDDEGPAPDTAPTPTTADPAPRSPSGADGATVVPFLRRTSTWLAAAAAVVLLAVGGLVWQPWASDPTVTAIEEVQQAPDSRSVSSTTRGLTATLDYSRELGRSAITVSGLPPAPEGRTYQVWYVGSDDVARSAGFLDPDAEGEGTALLQGDVDQAAAVGVSVEPAGGSQSPTTEPFVVMPLT